MKNIEVRMIAKNLGIRDWQILDIVNLIRRIQKQKGLVDCYKKISNECYPECDWQDMCKGHTGSLELNRRK